MEEQHPPPADGYALAVIMIALAVFLSLGGITPNDTAAAPIPTPPLRALPTLIPTSAPPLQLEPAPAPPAPIIESRADYSQDRSINICIGYCPDLNRKGN